MKKVFLICVILISGCSARGPIFNGVQLQDESSSTVYLFRQSAFVNSAYCPVIQVDNRDIGCLKNGGFMRLEIGVGEHNLRVRKRLLEVGGEPEVTINGKKGEVLFYEWTSQLNHMSMIGSIVSASVSEGIIKHNESTATQILGSLRENRHKYNKK